jgi:hypothetical protein
MERAEPQVAAPIRSRVQYEVQRLRALRVALLGHRIHDVRQSA